MNLVHPAIFPGGVCAAFSTREGGVSPAPLGMNLSFNVGDDPENVRTNRTLFFSGLGISQDRLAIPRQVHGATVRVAGDPGEYPDTDGLITSRPGLFLCVAIADCVPILMYDPVRRAVGAVHAGWRGTAAGILTEAVRQMQREFGSRPPDIFAHIGPSADLCCYSVGEVVAAKFPPADVARRDGKLFVNLKESNRRQLIESGLLRERIETSPYCTISDSSLFHSHRRDGSRSGRSMGVIGLTA